MPARPAKEENPFPEGCDPTRSMELVVQGQRGDARAVNELFTRYIPRLRRIICIKIPPGQRARIDPDDVLQETMIVATRRLNELELRTRSSIIQWLTKIADLQIKNRFEYLSAQKRDGREQRIQSDCDSVDQPGVLVSSDDPTPSECFSRNELLELVDRQVQQVEPADYREVILQRDYYELEWEEVRVRLGRPSIEAVHDLYQRAWKRVRERTAKFLS